MAKYRIHRRPGGDYVLQARLGARDEPIYVASVKGVAKADVAAAGAELATRIQKERERRGIVPVDSGIPGVTD